MFSLLKDIFVTFPLALLRGILFVPNVLIRRLIAFFSDPFSTSLERGRTVHINNIVHSVAQSTTDRQDLALLINHAHHRSRRLSSEQLYLLSFRLPRVPSDNPGLAQKFRQLACHRFVSSSDELLHFVINDCYSFIAKELDVIARALGSLDRALIADNSIGNVIRRLEGKKTELDRALADKRTQIENINQTSPDGLYLRYTIDRQNLQSRIHRCQTAIGLLEKVVPDNVPVPVDDFLSRYQSMQQPILDVFDCYSLSANDVPDQAAEHFERFLKYWDEGPNGEGIDCLKVYVPETSSVIRKYTDSKFVESEMTARRFFAHTCIHAMMRMPYLLQFAWTPYNFSGTSDHSLTFAVNQLLKTRNEIMSKRSVDVQGAMQILFDENLFTGIRQLFWYRPIDDVCLREAYQSVQNRMRQCEELEGFSQRAANPYNRCD